MWKNIKESLSKFLSELLSVNEARKSIVVIVLIFLTIGGLYKLYTGSDLPPNVSQAIIYISGYIFGVNAVNSLSNAFSSYVSGYSSSMLNNQSVQFNSNDEGINKGV